MATSLFSVLDDGDSVDNSCLVVVAHRDGEEIVVNESCSTSDSVTLTTNVCSGVPGQVLNGTLPEAKLICGKKE